MIAVVYRVAYQGVLYQKSYAITLVLTGLVTTSVIMAIAGNLALSLGMVGALSIIRFRTAVKDPMDVIYMFWVVTVGIANGVAYFNLSISATILISVIMIATTRNRDLRGSSNILMVRYSSSKIELSELNKTIMALTRRYRLKSHSVHKGGVGEVIYEVQDLDIENLQDSMSDFDINDFTVSAYYANS